MTSRPAAPRSPDASALARWARADPRLVALEERLPSLRASLGEPGLYVDDAPSPLIVIGGEVRVSVLRVLSRLSSGRLVLRGQIQAAEDGAGRRKLRAYIHHPDTLYTEEELDGFDAWFIRMLDAHYAAGGPLI